MDRESKKLVWKGVRIGILSTIAVLLAGTILFSTIGMLTGKSVVNLSSIEKITLLETIIDKYYIEDVDASDLRDGMYKGLVQGTGDEYSRYLTKEEYQEESQEDAGNYAGIGAGLQDVDEGGATVVSVYEGSPAAKAGLKSGDIIVQANDTKYSDCDSLEAFVKKIRGKEGTSVKIQYIRDGKTKICKMTRAIIDIDTVNYEMLENDIAFIQITAFNENTDEQFDEALEAIKKQGAKGVIFDLRINGGGLVDVCTDMLDEVLGEGTTVYTISNSGKKTEYTSDEEHKLDMPIVVLTSQYTASSAEIFTGAIRDFKAGTIIGTKTYGKGVVQGTIPFFDGSALVLTIAKYYTPKGECINNKGISPDIECEIKYLGDTSDEYDPLCDQQVQLAISTIRDQLK